MEITQEQYDELIKKLRILTYQQQLTNDTLEGGIWHTNIKEGAILGVLSDILFNTKIGTEALHFNATGHRNSALGYQALYSNAIGYHNSALGYQALYSNIEGWFNSALGYQALYSNTSGDRNTAIGHYALFANTFGDSNTAVGDNALINNISGLKNTAIGDDVLKNNTTGDRNTALGYQALWSNITGDENTAIGLYALIDNTGDFNTALSCRALYSNTTGYHNVAVGYRAGYQNETGNVNVFLGYKAGYYETGSHKLYIANSNTSTPLIYGEFDNNLIAIYSNLGIGTKTFGTNATRTLAMLNGTIPSTSPANAIQLYAEDVASSSELKVRDEGTTVTTLSPHNFELFKPDKNDPFPWSYHSINQLIGKKVNADISGALRELENLTGKKFLYYEDVDKISLDEYMEDKKQQLIANYIAENGTEVEVEKDVAWGEVEIEVQDTKITTGYDTNYEFDEKTGKVKEIKKPKYGKKTILKNKLRNGYRFNEETGKFLKIGKPTEKEAEKAIKKDLTIPDWIEERL